MHTRCIYGCDSAHERVYEKAHARTVGWCLRQHGGAAIGPTVRDEFRHHGGFYQLQVLRVVPAGLADFQHGDFGTLARIGCDGGVPFEEGGRLRGEVDDDLFKRQALLQEDDPRALRPRSRAGAVERLVVVEKAYRGSVVRRGALPRPLRSIP